MKRSKLWDVPNPVRALHEDPEADEREDAERQEAAIRAKLATRQTRTNRR